MKTCGLSIWVGNEMPSILKKIVTCNSKLFNNFYLITDLKGDYEDSIKVLPAKKYHKWIKSYFNINYIPAGNYQADILTYFGSIVLKECYGIQVDSIVKLDTDLLLYNRFLLKELVNGISSFNTLYDQCVRFNSQRSTYRNAAVSILGPESEVKVNDINLSEPQLADAVLSHTRQVVSDWLAHPTDKYTVIGPSLTNSHNVDSVLSMRGKLYNMECMTVNPGILTKALVSIPLEKDKLGIHLTVSDLRKCGFEIIDIDLNNGNCNLIVRDLCNFKI